MLTMINVPERSRVDTLWNFNITGLPPKTNITVSAQLSGLFGHTWHSTATFISNSDGIIDLNTRAPISGSYTGIDAMGLIWSMTCKDAHGLLARRFDLSDATILIQVANEQQDILAKKTVQRYLIDPDITITPIRSNGLVGTLYHPRFDGTKQSALIVLSGSEGGCRHEQAALLASEGYTAFALAYFIHDQSSYIDLPQDFPKTIHNVPLEYFEKAIALLQQQPHVDSHKIGVVGTSRGGELALLLGSVFPQIACVIAYVPNYAVQAAFGPSDHLSDEILPSWTFRGKPVPCLPLKVDRVAWFEHRPVVLKNGFLLAEATGSLFEKDPVSAGRKEFLFPPCMDESVALITPFIAVERINGPVLLISAGDDEMWPSKAMSTIIMERLRHRGHRYFGSSKHLNYDAAGHLIMTPYWPTTGRHAIHPVDSVDYDFGGSAQADAEAGAKSWDEIKNFLDHELRHQPYRRCTYHSAL